MICRNCGANLVKGLKECEFCGSPVDITEIGVGNTATTQSLVALLTDYEKHQLTMDMAKGDFAKAQRFVMDAFGLNGQQAYEVINQAAKYKDAAIPNIDILIKNLTPKSRNVLYFDDTQDNISKAKAGAKGKYLSKLGYSDDEKILMLYDNAIMKSGESGFTITKKCFYSSGLFLNEKAFAVPLCDIKTMRLDGYRMLINDRRTDLALIDANDYMKVYGIVSRIIRSNR